MTDKEPIKRPVSNLCMACWLARDARGISIAVDSGIGICSLCRTRKMVHKVTRQET